MKGLAVLGGAAILACGATQAGATIYIGLDDGSGSGIKTVYTGDGTAILSNYDYGGFQTTVSAQGYPTVAQPSLQTTSVNTQNTGKGTLTIYVTQTDLNSFTGNIMSSFTANQPIDPVAGTYLADGAATVIESAYYDLNNMLYSGVKFGEATFSQAGHSDISTGAVSLAGPFSETTKYIVTTNTDKGGSLNDTINLAGVGAVPEPATWAMMLAGFGFIGASLRQRRRAAVSFG